MAMPDRPERAAALFASPDLDRVLAETGRVALPMLDAATCLSLIEAYQGLVPHDETGMRIDFLREDRALVRALTDILRPVLIEALAPHLPNHVPFMSSFVVKNPGDGSAFYVHRDLPMNDERDHRCYSVWIPLADVGPDLPNGGLGVIPSSSAIQAGAAGFDASVLYSPYREHFTSHLVFEDLAAGTGLIYDSSTLHASPPNQSDGPRYAIGSLLARRDVPVTYVHRTGRRHRQLFEVDERFFIDLNPMDLIVHGMPDGYELLDEYDEQVDLRPEDISAVLGGPLPVRGVDVPPDLATPGAALAARSTPVIRWWDAREHDLVLAADELRPCGDHLGRVAVVEQRGSIGCEGIDPAGRSPLVHRALAGVPDTAIGRRQGRPVLVVLDRFSRLQLRSPGGRWSADEVVVIDGPPTRAGICSTSGAAELVPGHAHALVPDEPTWLWNDGPGPLVVLVRTVGSRRDRLRLGRRR